ncbi:uncharacterized protein [Anabrus simplex]|uniref:uncharacterized protein isoform X2 n=1 Tax=Anabrus simplex TaxID=316456 RepID=UPI0034DDC3C6
MMLAPHVLPGERGTSDHIYHHQGDEGSTGQGRLQTRVFQQSVTLTAKMWPDDNGTAPPSSPGGWKWGSWRIPSEYLPLLVGTVCGGALLVLILVAAIIWRCCIMPRRDKAYCTRMGEEMATRQRGGIPPLPSHSAVYAAPKSGQWAYCSRLVGPPNPPMPPPGPGSHWFYNSRVLGPSNLERLEPCPLPRSVSCIQGQNHTLVPSGSCSEERRRPISQPIRFGPCDPVSSEVRQNQLPEISEFTAQTSQYASSSILDEVGSRGGEPPPGPAVLKTRSLPAWVRSRSRPLSTEDDLAELYAKVNFSKKRKNRMRNDEAAIIALSKSRSQYLHKDTDSLVDNEAVIVYDERTAL